MIKFLLISFLIFFIVFKLLKFFFKLFLVRGAAQFQQRQYQSNSQNYQQRYQKPREGNINIDFIPNKKKEREEKTFKGGEYIDYEEVK